MEMLLLALVIAALLALAPVRARPSASVVHPPAISKQVDVDAVRGYKAGDTAITVPAVRFKPGRKVSAIRTPAGPRLEDDNVETFVSGGRSYTITLRGDTLFLREQEGDSGE